MSPRGALDSNILVYALGVNGTVRREQATDFLDGLDSQDVVVPVQALGELFTVLTRKSRWPSDAARAAVFKWSAAYQIADTTPEILTEAMEVAVSHQFSLWDSIMVATAAQNGCQLLWSEDMQDGFIWRGVTIRNPFAAATLPHAPH